MKKNFFSTALLLLIFSLLISGCANPEKPAIPPSVNIETDPVGDDPETETNNPVEGWAVLAEKDDYSEVGMSELPVDYIDISRMRGALEKLGWDPAQIHDLKEFDQEALKTELDWLEENADGNDLVFFYVTGHGTYLRKNIAWSSFFPQEWAQIPAITRILVVDACTAAEFTIPIEGDPNPHLSIAAVDKDEYGWKGLEEEGLPIIGGIFTFYFAEALVDLAADGDGDGKVSIQEAVLAAETKQREYMHKVVFAVPEFVENYHGLGVEPEKDESFPDVIVFDSIEEPVFLTVAD
ncbi:MAG: caspase family protein [Anaerolineales bacterium]|nr:caspase family protein [Anaerolineales bacterium]